MTKRHHIDHDPVALRTDASIIRCFCAVAVAMALLSGTALGRAATRQDLTPGEYVEITPLREGPSLRAAKIQMTSPEESPSDREPEVIVLRSPIEEVDSGAARLRVLGAWFQISNRTKVSSEITGISDFREGEWIKLTARALPNGSWEAERIRTQKIPHRRKLEGTITAVWPAGSAVDSISLGGFIVHCPANTRVLEGPDGPSERIFRKVLDPRRGDDPAPWLYREGLWSRGKAGVIQRWENDYTIGDSASDNYSGVEPQFKLEFAAIGPSGLSAFAKFRSRTESIVNDAPLRDRHKEPAVHVYEAFALWRDIAGAPVAIQAGRQDFDEYREWLFDAQLDALRLYAYPLYPVVAEAAYINSLDDSPENKFRTTEDFLLHVHGRLFDGAEAAAYRLWRTDSGPRGQEPIWTGLRFRGTNSPLRPWVDIAWLRGWDKGRRFRAQAVDLGTTVVQRLAGLTMSATVGYANASGNDHNPKETGINEEFRQTGYEDNTGTFAGVTSLQYYGEVFDPELSNMSILTLGAGCRPSGSLSIDVIYHTFQQSEYSEAVPREIQGTDLTVYDNGGRGIDPSNGRPVTDLFPYKDIGWELDVVTGLTGLFGFMNVKWVFGYFSPGDALRPPYWDLFPFKPKEQSAVLNQLNLEWRF